MSSSWNRSRLELVLLAVALLAAACGGHAQPRVVGHYLVYGRNLDTFTPSIVLADPDGSGAHTVAHGENEVLSPDGRWVAYDGQTTTIHEQLFVVSTSGGKPRLLARTDSFPVWSPSSDRIVTYKANALVSVDLHGHVTVLDAQSASGNWTFSPDGRWVAYIGGPDGMSNLFVVRTSGGGRRLVTRHADYSPVWGTHWIAFARAGGIWRVRPDGSGLRRVLAAPPHPGRTGIWSYTPVAWTPDDRALLGQIGTPHAWDVGIRVDVATGRFTDVHGYPVGLSRDGRFALAFGGRATGGPDGGPQPPEWIAALPFGHSGHRHVLALGDVCCPSWNR